MIEITRASGTGYFTLPFPRGIGIDLVDPPTSRSASDSRLLAGTPDTPERQERREGWVVRLRAPHLRAQRTPRHSTLLYAPQARDRRFPAGC